MTSGYSPHRRDDRRRTGCSSRSRTGTTSFAHGYTFGGHPVVRRRGAGQPRHLRARGPQRARHGAARRPFRSTLEKLLRPADRRRRPRRRLLLRHRAGQGQGHQGDVRRRRVRAAAARVPVQGAVRRRAVLPRRRPRRPGRPARAAADLRAGRVRRDRADPARRADRGVDAALWTALGSSRSSPDGDPLAARGRRCRATRTADVADRRAPATPGCGPRTTCCARIPSLRIVVLEARDRRVRRDRAQRRLVLGAVPGVGGELARRHGRDGGGAMRRGDARHRRRGRQGRRRGGHRLRLRQGRHGRRSPARRAQLRRAGEARGSSGCRPGSTPRGRELVRRDATCSARSFTPALRARPPGAAGPRAGARPSSAAASRIFEGTAARAARAAAGRHRPRHRARATSVVRATEAYTAGLRRAPRAVAPVYSLMVATEPLPAAFWDEIGLARRRDVHRPPAPDHLRPAHRRRPARVRRPRRAATTAARAIRPAFDRDRARLRRTCGATLRDLFPGVDGAAITHAWGGPLGVPRDWHAVGRAATRRRARLGGRLRRRRRGDHQPRRAHARRPDHRTRRPR